MRLLQISKKSIIPFVGILMILFLLGCGQGIVNNQVDNKFDGIWEMEYSKSMLPVVSLDNYGDPIAITLRSVLTFAADSFNLQIIATNSYQYLNRKYAGNYSVSADTIIFNVIYIFPWKRIDINNLAAYGDNEKLQFKFISPDSLKFNVISTFHSDGMVSMPMTSFLWNTGGFLPSRKTSGTYARIDI